ncbi:hypothetical protein ACFL35_04635 [Candidatus Riflebacteria bacterium]
MLGWAQPGAGMKYYFLLLLYLSFFFCGCGNDDDTIELGLPDLELRTNPPPSGILGQQYIWEVKAGIANSSHDDTCEYRWIIHKGKLPKGLVFYRKPGERVANISGIPEEVGSFAITLYVESNDIGIEQDSEKNDASKLLSPSLYEESRNVGRTEEEIKDEEKDKMPLYYDFAEFIIVIEAAENI